jgi:effector-binding domain-containing protein
VNTPVTWFEIIGQDALKLQQFYSEVFDWNLTPPVPEMGNYSMVDDNNKGSGIGGGIGQGMEGDSRVTIYIELGVPVVGAAVGDGRVQPGVLPAGRYAALVYTGVQNGVEANRALLEWGAEQGLVWDTYDAEGGDGFGARYESDLTDPAEEPDMAKWETEVAIRLADGPVR